MEKKFTLGPWIQDDDFVYHLNSNGHNSFGFKVGFSCVCADCKELQSPDAKATASLIKVAPELLEALEEMLKAYPSDECTGYREIVRKAYGEPG